MDTEHLYSLTMYNEWQEGFFIGLFASRGQAEQVGQEYLRDVPGFRDYPCTCEVTEKRVLGEPGPDHRVYLIWAGTRPRTAGRRRSGAASAIPIPYRPGRNWKQPGNVCPGRSGAWTAIR